MQEQILELYKNGVTLTEISKKLSITVDKVRYTLKKHGAYTQTKRYNIKLDETVVCTLYQQDVSVEEIAEKFSVSVPIIRKTLKKHNIFKPAWLSQIKYKYVHQILDKEFVYSKYCESYNKQTLADYFECGKDMIDSAFKRHNLKFIERGTRPIVMRSAFDPDYNRDTIYRLYVTEHLTLSEIKNRYKIGIPLLKVDMQKWGIPLRGLGETKLSKEFFDLKYDVDALHQLVTQYPLNYIAQLYNCTLQTLSNVLQSHNIKYDTSYRSTAECELYDLIKNFYSDAIFTDRSIIAPYELDIVIPSINLAIEYCGLYWHSDMIKVDKLYHYKKMMMCAERGYQLITIFEDEYTHNTELVINKLKHILHIKTNDVKIHARQCSVHLVSHNTRKEFLSSYHIQGSDLAPIRLGLYYKDELISLMTFNTPNRIKGGSFKDTNYSNVWELNRYATKSNVVVRGGAGKLLKYFITHFEWDMIYSYADRRWSVGNLYKSLNFTLKNTSPPNYWYVKFTSRKRVHRYNFNKRKLISLGYDGTKTERQIMNEMSGYGRIWDCGHLRYELVNARNPISDS